MGGAGACSSERGWGEEGLALATTLGPCERDAGKRGMKMAEVIQRFEHKSVGSTVPGELVRVALRGSAALCININGDAPPDHRVRLGIINWKEADYPIWFNTEPSHQCLSFGTDWVVDYDFSDGSIPNQHGTAGDQKILLIAQEKALLRFDPPSKGGAEFDSVLIDISAGARVDYTSAQKSVPFGIWRIWASTADIVNPRAKALIEFG